MNLPPLPDNWRALATHENVVVNALPQIPERSGDHWQPAGEFGGDCEDLALEKLERLVRIGFPIERLRLASCWIGRTGARNPGEAHVVLVLDADDDQYVLDNRYPYLMDHAALVAAGYTRHGIQAAGGSTASWVAWEIA